MNKPLRIGLFFAVLFSVTLPAVLFVYRSSPVSLTVSASRNAMLIGDTILYRVRILADRDIELQLPDLEKMLAAFVVKEKTHREAMRFGRKVIERRYLVTQYACGEYRIPKAMLRYRKKGATAWRQAEGREFAVTVKGLVVGDINVGASVKMADDLIQRGSFGSVRRTSGPSRGRDADAQIRYRIKDAASPKTIWTYKDAAFASGVAAIGAAALYALLRAILGTLAKRASPGISPSQRALQRLGELKAKKLHEKGMAKELCAELFSILQGYVTSRFGIDALEMTTQEFLEKLSTIDRMTDEHKQYLHALMTLCDRVRFSPHLPEPRELDPELSPVRQAIQAIEQHAAQTASEAQ